MRTGFRRPGFLFPLICSTLLMGCSGDVAQTDEYQTIESRLDEVTEQLVAAEAEAETLHSDLVQAEGELEQAEKDLASSELSVAGWEERANQAEAELNAELNRPWPETANALFVEGCVAEPTPELSAEQTAALCSCIVDSLEGSVSFTDFMTLSLAALDSDAELNPLTGLPTDLDEAFAEIFVEAVTTCAFTSTAAEARATFGSDGPFTLGVSNNIVGNGWREQMICAIKAEALASGAVDRVLVIERDTGVQGQIEDIRSLIEADVDAILFNPPHATAFNAVIGEATRAGIPVFVMDNAVTSQDAFIVSTDQHAYAELGARWLFETLGGKGDVAYMRGIDGVGADTLRDEGFQAALSEYPDISIVSEVFTDWSPRTGAQQALEIITTQPVDGIWTSGIDYSVVEQFQVAGLPYVPIVGADNNAFIGQLLNIDGLEGVAVSNPPSIGGVATALALRELQGEDIDQWNLIEPVVLNTRRELSGVFHDYLPSGWSSYMVIEPYVSYTADQVLACTGPGE